MFIGLDLGTTVYKSSLFNENGMMLRSFNREYPLIHQNTHIEQNADLWWDLTKEAISFVSRGYEHDIKALSISSQGISVVPIDIHGKTLCNAVSWMDNRASKECDDIETRFTDHDIYMKTGKHLNPAYTLPKIMWFRNNHPEVYEKAHKFLLPLDYLNFRLCGRAVTDYSMASGTMLFNITYKKWDNDLIRHSEIDTSKLPEVECMGTVLGKILPSVARDTGINENTLIVLGAQDQKIAAIGAGLNETNCAVSIGTSTAITRFSNSFITKIKSPQFLFNETQFIIEESISITGAVIKWLSGILGGISYSEMDKLAENSVKRSNGVIFSTNKTNGLGITEMSISTTKGEMVYALYESIARKIKAVFPSDISHTILFGGGAKSEILCEIISEKIDTDIRIADNHETATLGAAILASDKIIQPCKNKRFISKGERNV